MRGKEMNILCVICKVICGGNERIEIVFGK